ncbi:uncharacterized protein F5Z01DRAFT_690842 [Emericellopsis atlantica]|uniref:Uncharacterized protein n=1 Tax=Emericellopsis atlantica TaxID=2614577 RepID=A0A9P8CMK9_9HYPO|nr:uncharacterized protein F5Z01DRAFT_690842 [Emericellopsis atlantica]KAG9252553.1 hypothetical protein F5Z01DRAFT_690842 [Emericellopsis atlantica]
MLKSIVPLYPVYKIKLRLSICDPDIPSPAIHTIIFVETGTHGHGSGFQHYVTGDCVRGMHYETKRCPGPSKLENLCSKELIGHVEASSYPKEIDNVLRALPAPPRQKAFNLSTMKTEPVKCWDPLTFYGPGDVREPLKKCTEWTEEDAIPALIRAGAIVPKK